MELLSRVRDKIFNTLGGAAQGVGNYLQQDFNRQPAVQAFNNVRQAAPQIQQQVQRVIPQIQEQVQRVVPQIQHTTNAWWEDQLNRPAVPTLDAYFPGQTPTTGDALNFAADVTYRLPTRVGAEAALNAMDTQNFTPESTLEKFILGDQPVRRYDDPDRWAANINKATGLPVPLLIAAGVVSDVVPDPSDLVKGAGKKVGKNILGEGGEKIVKGIGKELFGETGERVVKTAGELQAQSQRSRGLGLLTDLDDASRNGDQNMVKKIAQQIQDQPAGSPYDAYKETLQSVIDGIGKKPVTQQSVVNAGEQVVKNISPPPSRPTEELFQAGKPGDPFKPGNKYSPKVTVKKLFEDTFRASQGVIERSGEAGKEIGRLLDAADQQKSFASGFAKNKLRTVFKGMKGDELETFADVVQGYAKPVSERQAKAVQAWAEIADDVARQAKKVGLNMNIRENYFPHQTLPLSNADKRVIAQEMVDGGKASTVAEALQDLESHLGSFGREAQRRFGNLELPRETMLPYNKSPNALFDYVDNAYGRISDVKHFGKSDETLYELARAAGTQGGDANQITKYLDQILGKNQQGNWSKKLTSLQTITKLSPVTSAINLTQNLSTWLRTDTGTMLKTMKHIVTNTDDAIANAYKVGEISPTMAKELQDMVGTGNAASKWIRIIGMQGTEKFNRIVAVNAGIDYGQKLAKQAAKGSGAALRELKRLGIKPSQIVNGELTDDALKTVGREVSKATQFATGAGELPYFWRTNVGKVMTQFKSFAFKQTGFMKDEGKRVLSEGVRGNVKPLINALAVFGIAAPIAGEIVNDFKSLVRNKKREDVDSFTERYFSNILSATSFGLLDSTSALFGEFGATGVVSTLGGPTAGDVMKTGIAVGDTATGATNYDPEKSIDENLDPKNTTKRAIVKGIPAIGQTLSNTFIPNAGVDNYAGANNGLNKTDNKTYKELLADNPAAAEEFKKSNKWFPDSEKKEKGKTAGAITGDEVSWESEAGRKTTVSLKEKDLSGKTGVDAYDKDSSSPESKAVQIWGSPLPEKEKLAAYKKLGVEPDDVRYAWKTRSGFTNDERTSYIRDQKLDHDTLIERLITGRVESITGRFFATEGVIENLADEGLITRDEAKTLKNLKIDKDGKSINSGSSGGSGGSGGLTPAKLKSKINSLNSLFKSSIGTSKSSKSTAPKTVKAPELKFKKIAKASVKRRKKTSKQWFS